MGERITSKEIEKIFYQEVREKKRIGYGAYHNSGRRGGGNKGVRTKTRVDYLKGKEKKEYTKGGVIKMSNVYDDIKNLPNLEELKVMDFEKAKHIIGVAKKNFKNAELLKHWDIKTSSSLYSSIYYKYGIVEKKSLSERNAIRRGEKTNTTTNKTAPKNDKDLQKEVINSYKQKVKELQSEINELTDKEEAFYKRFEDAKHTLKLKDAMIEELTNVEYGMELKFKGNFEGNQIVERIMKYLETLIDSNTYDIDFNIKEQIHKNV